MHQLLSIFPYIYLLCCAASLILLRILRRRGLDWSETILSVLLCLKRTTYLIQAYMYQIVQNLKRIRGSMNMSEFLSILVLYSFQ
ncbi:hypothetical protein BDDG_08604 [Blastomyces dermatitidis ATCC 18188]|uniref:Uncharacterized protein n=1 Tax=Ajellomyces dermatitidis (strain ATCC 18188 / CBS 674.68) TaxID=653446 RepID=F2TQZ6_AJEDA|nr:hypothetical protein BDDG_08604 [Blastomyces dermatitidis ATCC 18188]